MAGIVAFGADALVERLPSDLAEIDRIASTPVRDATDIGAALRLAGALFPDDAQKRIVLLSDGNDTTGSGQSEAALAAARGIQVETRADRPRRARRGARPAADVPVDRPARRVDRRPATSPRRSRSPRPCGCSSTASWPARRRSTLDAGTNPRHVQLHAQGSRVPALPDGRRGGARHVQPERPGRGEHDRQGRAQGAGRQGRRDRGGRAGHGARDRAPGRRHGHPRGPAVGPRRARRLRLDRAGRRAAAAADRRGDGRAPGLRPRPRPRAGHGRRAAELRRRRLHRHAARGDAAGRHGRARPREAARRRARGRHRQVGLDGRLPLQQLQRRRGRRVRDRRRAQGRHRQGGDPASGLGPERPGRARASWRSTTQPTGSSRPRRSAASQDIQAAIAGINAQRHRRTSSPGSTRR